MNEYAWPAGYAFTDNRTLTRGACAGDLAVRYSPGAGNEMRLIGGKISNLDTVARLATIGINNGSALELVRLARGTIDAQAQLAAPSNLTDADVAGTPDPLVSGDHQLQLTLAAVAATEDAMFRILLRCRGGDPTITEVNA